MIHRPKKPREADQAGRGMRETAIRVTPLQAQVLVMARRRCDQMDDGPAARAQMKREVLDTPANLLADLLIALGACSVRRQEFLSQQPSNPKD